MSELWIWLLFWIITIVGYIVFISIKEETKDWKLKAIKTLSACVFCIVGIALLIMTLVFVTGHFFPNWGSGSSASDNDCEREPLFGGCN